MKVSIVIPAYNESENIITCLKSAIHQTVKPHEVIIVDNNSTDDSMKQVSDYVERLKNTGNPEDGRVTKQDADRIIVLHQSEKQGITPTRNMGFNAATGDVIGRFDADCIIREDWVQECIKFFKYYPNMYSATGPVVYYDMPFQEVGYFLDKNIRRAVFSGSKKIMMLFGSNMALKKEAWDIIKDEACDDDDTIFEDVDIACHLAIHNLPGKYCTSTVVGMSARRLEDNPIDFKYYIQKFRRTYYRHGYNNKVYLKVPEYIFMTVYWPFHYLRKYYMKYYTSLPNEYKTLYWSKRHTRNQKIKDELSYHKDEIIYQKDRIVNKLEINKEKLDNTLEFLKLPKF
jgi:glycosyltransferase involved in cell wall biosynthesis